MPAHTQDNRPIRVTTELGTDVLLLQSFAGQEGVSTPFSYTLDLWSADAEIDPQELLGTPICITLQRADGEPREIHGRVSRFTQLERREDLVAYRAQVVPWLWFLSLSSNCKTFQHKTVLDIVKEVFESRGYSGESFFKDNCGGTYPQREYCVQYRETDLNFVSRLLEEEGIFYYFEHGSNRHVMVLSDADDTAENPCPGQSVTRYAAQAGAAQEEDVVTAIQLENAVHVGKVTLRDYDYLQARDPLERSVPEGATHGIGEVYEYPGSFGELAGDTSAGELLDRYAKLLLDEREAWSHVVRGESTARAFQSGYAFELTEHYRSGGQGANQKYRLLYLQHAARTGDYLSGDTGGFAYRNSFVAIPHAARLRPPRTAPKPVIHGSQTALVVGKENEEIWTDDLGRVNVQFYWDRVGERNENSSCKVRVATSWAGKNWGFIQIPRIGEEVIVDFLEGDPDRPIITGRVYNSERKPPYALNANQTQSGIKSRSSKNGGEDNYNEIRFEDLKDSEQIVIHAEKDMVVEIENDRSESIGHDETVTVGNNRTESVGNDESITIEKNRTESVGENESVSIDGNRSLTVSKDETIDITGKRTDSVGKAEDVTVGDDRTHNVGKDDKLDVGKNFALTAGDSITLKTGDASISMKKNGDITIKGNNIKIEGSGKITIKADSDVNIKGSKVTSN